MSNKDFKVKNKLQVGGITTSGPVVSDAYGNLDSTSSIATQFGGTGTTTSPTSGQILYSSAGTTYAPATLAGLPGTYAVGNTASRPGSPSLGQIYSNTQTGYIEVYTNEGWSQLGVIPLSATIGTATDVGTNRPYNNGAVSVSFTPAVGGGLVSSFTAVSTSGGYSGAASSSPIIVTDIPIGTSTTFTVTATNGYGNALATAASNSATVTTLPQAPTIGTATATTGIAYGSTPTASLTFTAGATGGKTISNYKYSIDDSTYTAFSPEDATSPVTIPGLTAGQSYTIKLKAVNANGDSIATAASNSILAATVPQAPTIGTVTRTSNTQIAIPFTAGATGGSAITSYTVTASPSVGDISVSGTTSPLTVTGTFAVGTEYTFSIVANNSYGTSISSSSSNALTVYPGYVLAQTFNSSGTYTVPSGKNLIAFAGVAGGGGSAGNPVNTVNGGKGGGGGGGGFIVREISTSSGSSYSIVIGGAGNSTNTTTPGSSAGSGGSTTVTIGGTTIITANGGSGGANNNGNGGSSGGGGGNASKNTGTTGSLQNGGSGGIGGNGVFAGNGNGGSSGGGGGTMVSGDETISSYTVAGGGGGGGGGSEYGDVSSFRGGFGAGGSTYGGNGGRGAWNGVEGTSGNNANGIGGGAGGAGGGGSGMGGGSGRTGAAGQVLVYIK